jgi:hypothetical protein
MPTPTFDHAPHERSENAYRRGGLARRFVEAHLESPTCRGWIAPHVLAALVSAIKTFSPIANRLGRQERLATLQERQAQADARFYLRASPRRRVVSLRARLHI